MQIDKSIVKMQHPLILYFLCWVYSNSAHLSILAIHFKPNLLKFDRQQGEKVPNE